ncbi:MAG: sugar isomerase [Clostridium sp.]|nr:sugar isomerase [Clostridium sp.]
MKNKKLFLNISTALLNQVVIAVCGLILPRAILSQFGSEVNGLVSSITQFLAAIAFLELGVGAVVQSSLYKPLVDKDDIMISKIIISANSFFKKVALVLTIYTVSLTFLYPVIVNNQFDFIFTASLVIIISISSFAQYYFGITNQILLNADQKSYIQLLLQSGTQILNTIFCIVLINSGSSIQIVKLTTSIIYMMRPLFQWYYVRKNYKIDYSIKVDEEPIKQKWNGFAQHLAAVVLDKTDVMILTVFSTLDNVSIYGVYYLVVNSLSKFVVSSTTGLQSYLGSLIAKGEKEKVEEAFSRMEIISHLAITLIFTICGCLLVPFVFVYTKGINDANYIVPVFSVLITIANAAYSFRNSYNVIIKAAGHYKETQASAFIEMFINIIVSVVLVIRFGLVGVAIGTLSAMVYRTVYFIYYTCKIVNHSPKKFWYNILVDIIECILICIIFSFIQNDVSNYLQWFILAVKTTVVATIVCFACNYIFFRDKLVSAISNFKKR